MRWSVTCWFVGAVWLSSCKDRAPSVSEAATVADRGWHAHELVVAAGEAATSCAEAGVAMQRVFVANRQAFVDAIELDRDKARLTAATDYIEAHQDRYADLETRMEGLSDRCGSDATVQAAFRQMESP